MDFKVWDAGSAPEASRRGLEAAKEKFGFVPNLLGVLAEAPAALEGYMAVAGAFEKSSLSPVEQQIVLLSASLENRCHYCVSAHTTVAKMAGAPDDLVGAVREDRPLPEPQLEALRRLTRRMVVERGWISDDDARTFLEAGYTKAQMLEVLVGIAQKTLSNYTNHIAHTPLDEAFAESAWEPAETKGARA